MRGKADKPDGIKSDITTVHPNNVELPTWCAFALGGIVTFFLVYIGIARPASLELARMRGQISMLERSVSKVVGKEGSVNKANSILAKLAAQTEHSLAAADSLKRICQLHQRLNDEANQLRVATASLDKLIALKTELTHQVQDITVATKALQENRSLQQEIINHRPRVLEAQESADRMIRLNQDLICHGTEIDEAEIALSGLVSIRHRVEGEAIDLDVANQRLDQLVELQESVVGQTDNLAGAMETLELAAELQSQFREATASFREIRHWLVEVVTMDSLVKRAMQTLEPLTALGNLRNMDDEQLRHAVRVMSSRHRGRDDNGERSDNELFEIATDDNAAEPVKLK